MRHTVIHQIAWIICVAVPLTGCTWIEEWIEALRPTVVKLSHASICFDLEVDGRLYYCQMVNFYEEGKYDRAEIRASLLSEERAKEYLAGKSALEEARENGKEWTLDVSFSDSGRVLPPIQPNHLQIIDDNSNKVLFEMPLEVLGVDVIWDGLQFSIEKLKEAMTKLIRENVTPQEPEMEPL